MNFLAGNAALTINGIIGTQLLTPMKAVGCDDDDGGCSSNTVIVTSKSSFNSSHGPERFTNYTLVLLSLSVGSCLIFTRFLPSSKDECHVWRRQGELEGNLIIENCTGYFFLFLNGCVCATCVVLVYYHVFISFV